jgi:hypothetical protein
MIQSTRTKAHSEVDELWKALDWIAVLRQQMPKVTGTDRKRCKQELAVLSECLFVKYEAHANTIDWFCRR